MNNDHLYIYVQYILFIYLFIKQTTNKDSVHSTGYPREGSREYSVVQFCTLGPREASFVYFGLELSS
jgi:hypothetical protein